MDEGRIKRPLRGTNPTFLLTLCAMWMEGVWALECERQRMAGRHIYSHPALWNHSIGCPSSFSWEWSTSRICCYDNYDRFYEHPYCCYSEMYKLVVAVGFICLFLLGTSFLLFFCWFYNLPHHILYLITFRKFELNNWLLKARNGPYVDPSYYAKEPFWSRGADAASQLPYPLRPMPPRIFYPAPPTNMKFRGWDLGGGDIPLFILASRQFHRNPYSARPQNRTPPLPLHHSSSGNLAEMASSSSRRSSLVTVAENEQHQQQHQGGGKGSCSSGGSSAVGTRRGSGWRNSFSNNTNNHNSDHNSSSSTAVISTPSHNNSDHHHYNNHNNGKDGGSHNSNRPHSSEAPFVIPMDDEEVASELREAIRLMDAKSDDEVSSTWNIAGDSLGHASGAIFMTNSSREVIRSESQDSTSSNESYSGRGSSGGRRSSADDIEKLRYNRGHVENDDDDDKHTSHRGGYQNSGNSNTDRMVGVTRVRFGGKVSVQLLNQQLSNSLGLSLNNLPNIQVIGNFGRDGMETIAEDESDLPYNEEEEMEYALPSPEGSRPASQKKPSQVPAQPVTVEEMPRISSGLDRIVTRASQEVPFRLSLPGTIPEGGEDEGGGAGAARRKKTKLNRRNSAPVNF